LLTRLEQLAARIVAFPGKAGSIEQMSAAERLVRAALEVGDVGTSAFRAELLRLLVDHVATQ
jgi:hypothetical protein